MVELSAYACLSVCLSVCHFLFVNYAERYNSLNVRYPTDVNLTGFLSQLEVSLVPKHTEELWYNETVRLDDYIYICVCVCVWYLYCIFE